MIKSAILTILLLLSTACSAPVKKQLPREQLKTFSTWIIAHTKAGGHENRYFRIMATNKDTAKDAIIQALTTHKFLYDIRKGEWVNVRLFNSFKLMGIRNNRGDEWTF